MPYTITTETSYKVMSGREGHKTVLAETTFPEGTFNLWGWKSPSQGEVLSGFGAVAVKVMAEKYSRQIDERQTGPAIMTEADAYVMAGRAAETVTTPEGDVTPGEALEIYLPLIGTVHRG